MHKNKILVFNVTNIDNIVYLDLYSFDNNLSRFKMLGRIKDRSIINHIESGKLLYKTKIDINGIDYDEYANSIGIIYEEINLITRGTNSKSFFNILNYSSDKLMIESIKYPDILKKSNKTESKYQLSKLYYNFDDYYYHAVGLKSTCFFTRKEFNKTLKLFNDLDININYVAINYLGVNELFKHYHISNVKDSSIFINFKKDYSQVYIFEGLTIVGTRIINVGYDALINKNEFLIKDLQKNIILPTYYYHKISKVYYNFEEDINLDLNNILSDFSDMYIENLTNKKSNIFNILSSFGSVLSYLKRLDLEYEYNFPMRVK